MLEQIRKNEEVTEHTDEHVYETQREYSEQHTYEYLSRETIIDIATKYENAWEHSRRDRGHRGIKGGLPPGSIRGDLRLELSASFQ
jgi:hypothetical protein